MRPSTTPRTYTLFTMRQVSYLRAHYQDSRPQALADYFGISLAQLYDLARRHGIKRRAPNGSPEWRQAA